jgi:hypothetical protein
VQGFLQFSGVYPFSPGPHSILLLFLSRTPIVSFRHHLFHHFYLLIKDISLENMEFSRATRAAV